MDKSNLRQKHLGMRKAAGTSELLSLSQTIYEQVLPMIRDFQVIGVYISQTHEVDTRSLIEWCLSHDKTVVVPKIIGSDMIFVEIKSLDACKPGILNILQPISDQPYRNPIDCQIIPMLAFNARGYRLGYGKGYYDAYLKDYKGKKIGLCFAFDRDASLIEDLHDVACEHIITN